MLNPIHMVDTLQVSPADEHALLLLLRSDGIPVMRDAGLELVSLLCTASDMDEDVLIQVTWRAEDHKSFNVIRKNIVTDPRWADYSAKASALWTGGTRRFFYPPPIEIGISE
jgi:hypothetical protein